MTFLALNVSTKVDVFVAKTYAFGEKTVKVTIRKIISLMRVVQELELLELLEVRMVKRRTLKMFMRREILIFLKMDSPSFSPEVARTTRTGKTRKSEWRSEYSNTRSDSKHSRVKRMSTWIMSSTLRNVEKSITYKAL